MTSRKRPYNHRQLKIARFSKSLRAALPLLICVTPNTPAVVCRGLYLFWLDGLFIALSFSFYSAFMAIFLLDFGASNSQVGLMSSLSSLCGIGAYMVASRATTLIGGRQRIVVLARTGSRIVLLIIALIPFFASGSAAIYSTIALVCVQVVFENMGSPAWTGLVADIVPINIRARYVASRNVAKSFAKTISVALAGQLIRALGFPVGYQVAFLLAAIAGLTAALFYSRIPLPPDPTQTKKAKMAAGGVFASKTLRWYVIARTVWALGFQIASPFYSVYVVKALGGNEATVGLLSSAGSITAVVGLVLFARILERHGLRRSWLVSGAIEAVIPWVWIIAPSAWFVLIPAAIDGLLLSGLEIVNLNTLLLMTSEENRTQFVAVNSAILSAAVMVGPILGGFLSDRVGFACTFTVAGLIALIGCALYYAFVPDIRPGPTTTSLPTRTSVGK